MTPGRPTHYLSRPQVAARLGLKSVRSLAGTTLPDPDVIVGIHRGWSTTTIDAWHAARPGRGKWRSPERIKQ